MKYKIDILFVKCTEVEVIGMNIKEKKYMKKYRCLCCGYLTLETRAEFDICPVCFWEDDVYITITDNEIITLYQDKDLNSDELLNIFSYANNGLTLKEARQNFKDFGACELSMKSHVRKPKSNER